MNWTCNGQDWGYDYTQFESGRHIALGDRVWNRETGHRGTVSALPLRPLGSGPPLDVLVEIHWDIPGHGNCVSMEPSYRLVEFSVLDRLAEVSSET